MTAVRLKINRAEWVRLSEAVEKTGLDQWTIMRWAQGGRIRYLQLGGESAWKLYHLPSIVALLSVPSK